MELNDGADAEIRLKQVVALGQAKVDSARFYLARIAEVGSRTDDALRWYGEVAHGEYFVQARVRGAQILNHFDRVLEARAWLQQGRERSPPDAPALAVAEAQLLRERGQLSDAFEFLQKQLTLYVDNDELLYEAGLAAERLQRLADAEKYFRRLIETRPKSPQGYNALGYSLADRSERLEEAETLIDKALALAPDDFYILDSKGWVLYRLGKAEQALDYLRRAYNARAEPEIAAHFGEVLWKLGRHEEASKLWREANQAAPDNAELMATMKRFLP
jgi:tetratricopeptide (TPR) repeat protein